MRLTHGGFSKTEVVKRFRLHDRAFDTPYNRYSYESKDKLYDVDVRVSDGDKTYHVNCGFETEPTAIHRAIERHFSI